MDWRTLAKQLTESLLKKMAWESQCKPLLKSHSLPVGLGAEGTKKKLFDAFEKDEFFAQKFHEKLYPHYMQLVYSGDCTLKIFNVETSLFTATFKQLETIKPVQSISSLNFPYLVPNDQISQLSKATHLAYQAVYDGCLYLFFSTKRTIQERTNINPNALEDGSEVKEFLKKYSSITAISENPRQYIDVVCLNPKDNTIEIRLDTSSIVAAKDINKLFIEIIEAFTVLLETKVTKVFRNPINLFPLIQSLYASDNCKVCELNFISAGGYVHSERDRSKTGDVREGDFHTGGVSKCEIKPYKISTRWSSGFNDKLPYLYELSLNSSYKELSKIEGGVLEHAIISSCPTISDLNKILTILKPNDELSKAS
ncbi:hypothetical protein [Pseudoalteromonas sp. ND6B]|uniref:hypothetical protein n=1 Tax=Pseudoalteromonas sp. ND6B TaxID=1535421 RepID=UPI00051A5F35|nr:hypothetical protein [Pseudoalteromonas sp. ND6B]KGK02585.1 hypothetical protein ND6B_0761 [Pseudoalteromonas sp. ND6B]